MVLTTLNKKHNRKLKATVLNENGFNKESR